MTEKQLTFAAGEAVNYSDSDAFVSDLALSDMFLPDDKNALPDTENLETLRRIWIAVRAPFRAYLQALGLNQSACARRFRIPLRTVQGWTLEERTCPVYVRLMMAELMGYVTAEK